MIENSIITSHPDTSVFISSSQLQEVQSRNKKLQVKLEEQEQKNKVLITEKQQLSKQLHNVNNQYNEAMKSNQVLQNSLQYNVHLLKLQKKETEALKQQIDVMKIQRDKDFEVSQQVNTLKIMVESLEKQLENKTMNIERLTEQVNQNNKFIQKIQSVSEVTAATKRESEDLKKLLQKQRQQKNFYKQSLASNIEKSLAIQQQFSRFKKIAKTMMDDLTTGFNRQKKIWKNNYSSDLTFYKQEYELFKGFVQDILRYLKVNNLCSKLNQISPNITKFMATTNQTKTS